jgi:hypothetical protein
VRLTGQYDNRATRPAGAAPAAGSKHDEPGASNLARSAEQPKSQARERGRDLSRRGGSAGGSEALGQGGGRELAVVGEHGLQRVHGEQAAE